VIYMRKMNKRKTGFTLIEIIIVVSIIVVLSTAAFVGASQVIDRANKNADDLEAHNGKNFESNAWNTVKNLSVDVDEFSATSASSIETDETDETDESDESEETTSAEKVTKALKDIDEIMSLVGSDLTEEEEAFLKRRQDLLDYGYLESEITVYVTIENGEATITGLSYGSTRKGFANGGSGGGGGGAVETTNRTKPEANIQSGVLGGSTKTEQEINAQYGTQVSLNINYNAINNANTVTVVYYYEGEDITSVDNFGSIQHPPEISIDNGLITITFDLSEMADWELKNMGDLRPAFHSSGSDSTTITIVEVKTT
jgi:prepilin-type N-terminal cleavage/methylation domain-containing protein